MNEFETETLNKNNLLYNQTSNEIHSYLSIEESFLNKKDQIILPDEQELRPLFTRTSFSKDRSNQDISSNFSIPYDISNRYSKNIKKIKDPAFPRELDPNFVNVTNIYENSKVSNKKKLAIEWNSLLSNLPSEETQENDLFSLNLIEISFLSYLKILNKFYEYSLIDSPERSKLFQKLNEYFLKLSEEIPKIKNLFSNNIEEALKELKESNIQKDIEIQNKQEALLVIERQNRSIQGLKQQIDDYKAKCSASEAQLRNITNSKTTIQRSSQNNQFKLQNFVTQIKEKNKQSKEINLLIKTLNLDLKDKTETLKNVTHELSLLEDQLNSIKSERQKYQDIVKNYKEKAHELRTIPTSDNLMTLCVSVGVYVNIAQKEMRPKKKVTEIKENKISLAPSEFKQNKKDMTTVQKMMGEKLIIKNVEDIKNIREVVLKNNNIFDWSPKSIQNSRLGLFDLTKTSNEESNLFSQWTIQKILNRAVKWKKYIDSDTQISEIIDILPLKDSEEEESNSKMPTFRPTIIKSSRFLSNLKSNHSNRKPKPIYWMIHTIRQIFDEKTIDDRSEIIPISEYIIKWSLRHYGKEDLSQKCCWDIYLTSHYHMHKALEIMLFVRFLDENWTLDQLTFFLSSRTWILQRCVSIPEQHEILDEYITETYMTKNQVAEFFKFKFSTTDKELIQDLTIRGWNCVDPKKNIDENPSIPMYRILELAVGELLDERVRKIRRMFAFYRLVPRMAGKRFSNFIKKLIPNIDHAMIDSLYRSSLVQNSIRSDLEADLFYQKFNSLDFNIECSDFSIYSSLYSMILNKWNKFHSFLENMLHVLSKNKSPEIISIVTQIRHKIFLVLESKLSFDADLFHQSYHQLLQLILTTCMNLNVPDSFTFLKQAAYFEKQIKNKFQSYNDDNENDK